MSGSYDEASLAPEETTDSFWEVGNYKRTVKRIDDGHRLCNDLMSCVQERAKIEKAYAQQLTDWAKRWRQLLEKGPQYGSLERAWGAIMTEADKVSELHQEMKNSLNEDLEKVKNWQKDAYHKQIMGGFKETKEAEDGFRKAQKPWAKKMKEVPEAAKKAYHLACKEEKLAVTREMNSKTEQSVTPEQQKKLQDKVDKCKQDVQKTQEKYEKVLDDVGKTTPQYMEGMEQVFEQCQQFEEKRLVFLKEVLLDIKRHLNLAESSSYVQVYRELEQAIRGADAQDDLRWFRSTSGPGMPMNWPQFEEWNPDLPHTAAKKEKQPKKAEGAALTNAAGVVESTSQAGDRGSEGSLLQGLLRLLWDLGSAPWLGGGSPRDQVRGRSGRVLSLRLSVSSYDRGQTYATEWSDDESGNPFGGSEANGGSNPFDEDAKGVRVRALYDYDGQEQDELSFKAGDELTKLGEEDEQGWCRGRLDSGQLGLYPANYVEVV
ncbi:Protein kinase C and casein kinase substrate in neurons protein 1 [Bos mutus]|uniref:Protein kinase C and casein kinase substrate in neurons protein 1 n=1 Tax=Bos mutus TaxID=72004 RepID=L8IWP7_9CETA|nr:Protein kinase C and casein kinase substrate in neurons protein 1 [Bos mutus]